MSNKLYKAKTKITSRRWKVCRIVLLSLLAIAFFSVWADVFLTSSRFSGQLDAMVEGKDYFIESVKITKKDYDSYYAPEDSGVATTNYFFYYDDAFQKKMFVDADTYKKYNVGDYINAYTADYINYGFTKEALLYGTEYKNNELKKCLGVILGAALVLYSLWMWIDFRSRR
jgi:hypothetical protein